MKNDFPDDADLHYLQWLNVSPFAKFLYVPHRMLFVFVFCIILLFLFIESPLKKIAIFLILSAAFLSTCLQDAPLVRPHPMFWRFFLGLSIMTILSLFAIILFGRDRARHFLAYLDPSHCGRVEPDRDYSLSCKIWDTDNPDPLHNVKSVVFDIYVPAHFFGWMVKAMILRDKLMCWVLSIAFEIVERSLKHWMPNFNECWWDSLILDVILCNGIGIHIGMILVRKLQMLPWDKRLVSDVKNPSEKLLRILRQVTPRSYDRFDWNPMSSFRKYVVFWSVSFFLLLMETNVFMLKAELNVSSESIFVAYLCFVHGMIGFPAIMEFYLYASEVRHTIGTYGMTAILLALTETISVIKMSDGFFLEPTPLKVKVWTVLILGSIILFPILSKVFMSMSSLFKKNRSKTQQVY